MNNPLGISFAGSDFEALEMSRRTREADGRFSERCVVAQSISVVDFSVPDDAPRKKFHLRRTQRGWEYDEFGLGRYRDLKSAASCILWPTRGYRPELRVYRLDGSLQCIALVDQWDEFFHRAGMGDHPLNRNSAKAER